MADILQHYVSWLFILAGSFFYIIGAIGLIRMPDVFTRMHATSVSDTLGAGLLIVGMMIQAGWGLVTAKLLIILAMAAIGVHPLMPVLIFGQVLPPTVLGISPAVFCAGLVTMWGVGAVVSPFSGTTLFMRRVGNLSAWRVAWLWNGPYGLLTTGILGVLMIVTRHLGLF